MPLLRKDTRDKTWMERAACLGQDPLVYDTDDDVAPSPEIRCFICEARMDCLSYALKGSESGTWGGMSRKQRDRVTSRKRKRKSCPNELCKSGEEHIYNKYGVGSCVKCGVSWYTDSRTTAPKATRGIFLNPEV